MGHQESADDVDRRQDDRRHADQRREFPTCSRRDQGPHDRDAADRVRAGHQRRVQRGGDLGDDFKADEDRQHEDGQAGHQGVLTRQALGGGVAAAGAAARPGRHRSAGCSAAGKGSPSDSELGSRPSWARAAGGMAAPANRSQPVNSATEVLVVDITGHSPVGVVWDAAAGVRLVVGAGSAAAACPLGGQRRQVQQLADLRVMHLAVVSGQRVAR